MSSSAATARVAASSAARRSARPWTSARDQAASTTSSRPRSDGLDGLLGGVQDEAPQRLRGPRASRAGTRRPPGLLVRPGRRRRERAGPRPRASASGGALTSRIAPARARELRGRRRSARFSGARAAPGTGSRCQRSSASSVADERERRSAAAVAGGSLAGRAGGERHRRGAYQPRAAAGTRGPRPSGHWSLRSVAHAPPTIARSSHPHRSHGVSVPVEPTVPTQPDAASPAEPEQNGIAGRGLSRRGFLRVAGAAGLTGVAASVAACSAAAAPAWSFGAPADPGRRDPGARDRRRRPPPAPASAAPSAVGSRRPVADPQPEHPRRLDRARRRRPRRRPPLHRQPGPGPQRASTATVFAKRGRHPRRRRDDYPELAVKPAFAQVPNLVITDAVTPLTPEMDGDVKVFRHDHRRDGVEDRREDADRRGARLQRAVAGPHDPLHRGRQAPGDLHQQPQGDDGRPLPRRGVRGLLPGRRPVRQPEAVRAGRELHLRVHGEPARAR